MPNFDPDGSYMQKKDLKTNMALRSLSDRFKVEDITKFNKSERLQNKGIAKIKDNKNKIEVYSKTFVQKSFNHLSLLKVIIMTIIKEL